MAGGGAGALGALVVMTVLSTALGFVVPNLISRQLTNKAATALYTFFGARLLYIAHRAGGADDDPARELDEVRATPPPPRPRGARRA
eukprot:scaffold1508_cov320-Prasinococcus_capsulatus_cf.AAC.1